MVPDRAGIGGALCRPASRGGRSRHAGLISRRAFVAAGLGAATWPLLHGCLGSPAAAEPGADPRLTARPRTPGTSPVHGVSELGLGSGRDGFLYVPTSYAADTPMPLWVALHGAGGSSGDWTSYQARAEARGFVLLAPDSRGNTWDLVLDALGDDVRFIDRALAHVFERCNIDPLRTAFAGFSDGASYALSLGLPNGDLFTHLVGYSPGFVFSPWPHHGTPRIFVSHGTSDTVLSFANTRDKLVPELRGVGYDVTFQEFNGMHEVPAEVSAAALDWFFAAA